MSTGQRLGSQEVLQGLQLLRSEDPAERRRGIRLLTPMRDDPRVVQVFEYLYEKDPDPLVRRMAWRALEIAGPSVPAPVPEDAPAPRRAAPPAPQPAARASKPRPPRRVRRFRRGKREPFLLNPSNVRLVEQERERRARRRKVGSGMFWLGAFILLLAAVGWGVLAPYWVEWFQFEQDGVTVDGVVIGRTVEDTDRYMVRYRFTAGVVDFEDEQRVDRATYDRLVEDTPVQVTYLRDEPEKSRLEGEKNPEWRVRDVATAIVGGVTVLALVLIIFALRRRRRALQLALPAVLTGQMLRCEGALDDDGDYKVRVYYRFRSPTGRTLKGHSGQIRNDLRRGPLPRSGTPVAILYRSDKSYRML